MKRKVIQLAHKTLVVSLPSRWVKKYGVKKGAELEVEERGQQITFSTGMQTDLERTKIDASGLNANALKRWVLSSLHKTGYNEIEISYSDPETVKAVQDSIRDLLIGFAIVDQSKNRCVIRVLAEEQEKEFDSGLRRAFLVTKSMGEGIYSFLRDRELSSLEELLVLEKTNNQLTNFCERILNKKGYKDDKKRSFAYLVAWNLEKLCDEYASLCTLLIENPNAKIRENILSMIKEANNYFDSYYRLFYDFDINRLSDLETRKNRFTEKVFRLFKRSNQVETMVLCRLNEFVIKTSDFSASFIALNMKD